MILNEILVWVYENILSGVYSSGQYNLCLANGVLYFTMKHYVMTKLKRTGHGSFKSWTVEEA